MTDTSWILTCPMGNNDAGAATVGDYMIELLARLWVEEEGFSSKRPFGNSGWCWEVYEALQEAGHLGDDFDTDDADKMIVAAIREKWGS